MSDPITAWRFWRVENDGFDFSDHEFDWCLYGDRERWDGPLKESGDHVMAGDPFAVFATQFAKINAQISGQSVPVMPTEDSHESPTPGCLCGVNALKRLRSRDLEARAGQPTRYCCSRCFGDELHSTAFAQVDLGSRVDEYDEGYRAQQALIAGPIYVVNPPDEKRFPEWRGVLERKYRQPVIVQELDEALDWIRKDEEANGYRRAHQDTRVGAAGGSIHLPGGTYSITLGANTAAFTRTLQGAGTATRAFNDALGAARERRRARTRLISLGGIAFSVVAGVWTAAFGSWPWLSAIHAAALVVWLVVAHQNRKPKPDGVTWDELKKWALAHGAKNDRIQTITIDRAGDGFAVQMQGLEEDSHGKPYAIGASRQDSATWRSTQTLRRLP